MAERVVCKGCGGEKVPGSGYRYCLDCIEKKNKKPGCVKCGEPRKFRSQYCEECNELRKWATQKKRHYNPKRLCRKCGKAWVTGLKQYCEPCRNPVILCLKCHTQPVRGFRKKLCELCYLESVEEKRRYHRDWQRRQREDPVEREKLRQIGKAYRERVAKSEARRLRLNETKRLHWRRIHGSKPLSEEAYLDGFGKRQPRLPAAPLAVAIGEYLSKGNSLLGMAKEAGVQEKRVGEVIRGVTDTVRMDIADKVCVVCGTTLEWVYREQVARGEISLRGDYDLDKAV